uniref:Tubulin-specific chaperone E n=1 Tax=Phallusia mammillata TaxID=59560 RepID=A0A6F9DV19_9ASCI|nr:tubulin-specific chaperone E-like [Phallusia mammillata]
MDAGEPICSVMADTDLLVDDRVSVDGYVGTVKFIGLVPPSEGVWIGIEWDDSTRGKHDGSKNGVVYFTCKNSKNGSFVRITKINRGITICEAIQDRYQVPAGVNVCGEREMFMITNTGQHKKVDTVGLDKVQKQFSVLTNLKIIGLRDLMISSSGPAGELSSLAPNITTLDLSKNLLSTWMSVCNIVSQLTQLKILNLSENLLSFNDECLKHTAAFSSVKTLILNKCKLTWNNVAQYAQIWPDVEELHLVGNLISAMSPPAENVLQNITFLNLSENKFDEWGQITKISNLPKLKKLFLNGCGLFEICCNENLFPHVEEMSIAENKFVTHQVFNELHKLPALGDLIFRKNTINEKENYEDTREIIVAKMKHLIRLNNSVITDRERDSAEMDYLKKFGLAWLESGGHQDPDKNNPSQEFFLNHPRYMELVKEYGAPADHELVKKSSALKGNLIEVNIEAPIKDNFKPVSRRLPLSMTVANLKMLVQRLTKIEVRKQRLVYVSKENPEHVVALDRDQETLHDVSIEPGDTVQVQKPTEFDLAKYIASRKRTRMFHQ